MVRLSNQNLRGLEEFQLQLAHGIVMENALQVLSEMDLYRYLFCLDFHANDLHGAEALYIFLFPSNQCIYHLVRIFRAILECNDLHINVF